MNILYVVYMLTAGEPLGVMQLSAITKKHGHKSFFGVLNQDNIPELIVKNDIHVVALSFMTPECEIFRKLVVSLRKRHPNLYIIAGGAHPTYFPEIADDWELDAIVIGEGDSVIVPLLERLMNGQSLKGLHGVRCRGIINPQERLVEDLASLPYIDRSLVAHHSPLKYISMKSFMATRGCPFACSYCFNSTYHKMYKGFGPIRRVRPIEHFMEEIREVKCNHNLSFIRFIDDVFTTGMNPWLDRFLLEYERDIKLPFSMQIHPQFVSEPLIKALKSIGLHSVGISIEAGSFNIRKNILGRNILDEKIIAAFDILNRHKILTLSNSMIALPGSTFSDEITTLQLTFRCHPTYAGSTIFTPFRGTKIFKICQDLDVLPEWYNDASNHFYGSFYGNLSSLTAFTEKEKLIQYNIMSLGVIANYFPRLRNLIIKKLIYMKPNWLFSSVSFVVRSYLQRRIWPFKLGFFNFFRMTKAAFKINRENSRRTEHSEQP